MSQVPPLVKNSSGGTNQETSQVTTTQLSTALPPNTRYYVHPSNVLPHPTSPRAVYSTIPQPTTVVPVYNINSQAVDPATGIPYVVVTTRREGCACSWELGLSITAVVLIVIGGILLGLGGWVVGGVLMGIGVLMGMGIMIAILVRRNQVTTVQTIQPTMQPFRQY